MNIAIIGYGKMGKEIEKLAQERNHNVVLRVDENNIKSLTKDDFSNVDVAIEFSVPESAFPNINLCFDNNIPVVSGTTGWLEKFDDVLERCKNENKTFFYASNYSIGVNLFFKLNKHLAKMMNNFTDYNVRVEETHHTQKLDAPSGTAITLAEGLIENIERKNNWEKEQENSDNTIAVKSFREGNVPGNHKIIYDSSFDKITIEHDAKSRKGFALGAILAAEFIISKKGYYSMDDLLKI
ncbi:MAG: 4-hydroxy-tetrahydrodipicolinate reductase [Bacteroidales bacterium]|nr:4-hydroxy-tetrahydrodipicolinate reductase [Bacteroidales bacterium]